VTTFAQTIYFAAISFGEVRKALGTLSFGLRWGLVMALALPLCFWIGSLWCAIRVFKPEIYDTNLDSPDLARETYLQIAAYKHKQLQRAYRLLMLGFVPLLLNVIAYLLFVPQRSERPIESLLRQILG